MPCGQSSHAVAGATHTMLSLLMHFSANTLLGAPPSSVLQSNWKSKYDLPYHLLTDAEGEVRWRQSLPCGANWVSKV